MDGNINLMPGQTLLRTSGGSAARLSTNPDGTDRIGMWSNPKAKPLWRMRLPQAGRYRVVIEQACDAAGAGSAYTLRLGKTTLKGRVQPTPKGWYDYMDVDLGVISITAGVSRVELARTTRGNIFMDVRRIRLVPVTGASQEREKMKGDAT